MVYRRFVWIRVGIIMTSLLAASCPSEPFPAKPSGVVERKMSPNTRRLYNFIADNFGQKIISGQMDTSWTSYPGVSDIDMIARVYADTGKYPALKGFDMAELPSEWSGYGRQQIDEAVEWWEGKNNNESLFPEQPDIHGIITFCWHWRVGQRNEFYTEYTTDFRIPWKNNALDTASDNFKTIVNDLDKVAALLQILKEKDIPVLWRPLHEASGGWFWWGASGSEPYIALWEYIYNYFTNVKKLDNLLWVWNGQDAEWFPNPATVDFVACDIYDGAQNYTSQKDWFFATSMVTGYEGRVAALSENGSIPDPDKCLADKAMWSWFMTWNDGPGSQQGQTSESNYWTGEFHNTQSHKEKVYNHELVITLDELPDLTKYRLE